MKKRLLCLFFLCSIAIAAHAQSGASVPPATVRDPQLLAEHYLGFHGDLPIPPLTPIYKVGDQAQFWVGKSGQNAPTRIQATLVAAAPNVYLWVEQGVTPSGNLAQTALQLNQIVNAFRLRDNYRQPVFAPGIGTLSDPTDLLPVPDVDNDPHLYILYATNLGEDRDATLNPIDSLPVAYAPYSNQHELLAVDTTPYVGTLLSDPIYNSMLTRGIYRWIMNYNAPAQAVWLTDALNWALLFNLQQAQIGVENLSAYLQAPDTPLIQPTTLTTQAQTLGGQQLFLAYLIQRYGSAPFTDLFLQAGSGITPLDAVLAQHNVIDPVSGAPVTGRDAFADFIMANGLNLAFGDLRYIERAVQLPQGQVAAFTALDSKNDMNGLSVSQFGAQYFRYSNTAAVAATVKLKFDGSATVARLPMPTDRDPADRFYWSGHDDNQDATLTRTVDLSAATQATLTFDAWYDLAPYWNYGYVSVSTDNGTTWKALSATHSSSADPNGTAYGPGFNGISNPAPPRPFPTLGVVIGGDGMTASDVVPDGPAAQAGVKPGDVIIGYDQHEWPTTPNVIGLLANYAPGDTLHFYIQRGTQRLDVPVVLGAHPTRIVQPAPLWLAQTVDLTPYAGKQILLRFETVTLPGHEDQGFAIDNLAIPEIHWSDKADGDAPGWTLNGWQQVDNQLAQRWLVQVGTSGTQTKYPHVQQLLNAGDTTASGEWRIALDPGETLTLVVAGVNDDTTERATFNLGFKN